MNENTYQAILQDEKFREQLLRDPEIKAILNTAFNAAFNSVFNVVFEESSSPKKTLLDELLAARREAGLSQADVAAKMGTKASAIGRLETGLACGKPSPSIVTLQKYAEAVGKKLEVRLV